MIGIRKEELAALRRGFMYGSIGSIAWIAAPILVALSSFTFFTVGACGAGRGLIECAVASRPLFTGPPSRLRDRAQCKGSR